jgi:glycosyltransferase involved in cell wall biosynthesis
LEDCLLPYSLNRIEHSWNTVYEGRVHELENASPTLPYPSNNHSSSCLFFRTAPLHICEQAVTFLSQSNHEHIDFFGNQDPSDTLNFAFRKCHIVAFNGYLDKRKVSLEVLQQIRSQNYQTVVFPYTVNGLQSYNNLLEIAHIIGAKQVILFNEFGPTAPQTVKSIIRKEQFRTLVLFISLFPLMLVLLYWFFRDFFRLKTNGEKKYSTKADIGVIGGTTDIEIEGLGKAQAGNGRIKIGCIARLDPVKGHVYLLHALAKVIKVNDNVELYLIGGGKEETYLQGIVEQLGLSQFVSFEGSQQDVRPYLRDCDIFVLPSLSEAMPISLIEVFAARRPIIATNVGGIPKIVSDGDNGLLVDPGSPEQLSEAILKLIQNPIFAQSIADNGFNCYREQLSPAVMGNKYAEIYSKLTSATDEPKDIWLLSAFDLTWVGGLPKYVDLQQRTLINYQNFEVRIIQPSHLNYNIRGYLRRFLFDWIARVLFIHKVIIEFYIRKMIVFYLFITTIIRNRPSVVNVHDVIAFSSLHRICKWFRIPLVLTKHGDLAKEIRIQYECSTDALLYRHFAQIERFAYKTANSIVVVDEESRLRIERGVIA